MSRRRGGWWSARRASATVESEVDDELRFHLETQVQDLVAAGWDPESARAEAQRRFGDIAGVERQLLRMDRRTERHMRRAGMVADIRDDLKFGLRQLRRRPGFASTAVLILGLGVGATAAVFAVVDGALVRPLPFPAGDRVSYVLDVQDDGGGSPPSWPEFEDWRREGEHFSAIAAFAANLYTLEEPGNPQSVRAGLITADFQEVLGIPPVIGRGFEPEEIERDEPVLMLSERYWRERYGSDRSALGEMLVLNGERYTVIGVMPRAAEVLVNRPGLALWLPLVLPEPMRARGFHLLTVMARSDEALSRSEAEVRTAAMSDALLESGVTRHGVKLADVRTVLVGDSRELLLALSGAVLFLLLVVAANLSNLFLSRSTARAREFAIRTAIGAGRFRLTRQILTETLVIGVLGGAVGLVFARFAIRAVAAAADRAAVLAPASAADPRLLLFTVAASLGVALMFGMWPAFRARRIEVARALRESDSERAGGTRSALRGRRILVAVELALSVVLLAGAALMVRSVQLLLREDPGFSAGDLLALEISLPPQRYGEGTQAMFFGQLLDRLRALPGVRGAAAVSHLPLDGSDTNGSFQITGRTYAQGDLPHSKKRIATPSYFETMGIPLVRGRTFDERDRAGGRDVVVISESIAERYWPGEDPIGREIAFGWGPSETQEIVGIVGDVKHDGLDIAGQGAIYRPHAQFEFPGMTVVVRAAGRDPLRLAQAAREAVLEIDPLQPVRGITTVEALVRRSASTRTTLMALLAGFAVIALLLAAVGVYAVTAQAVGQRTREMGIRMALGARAADVLRLVLRDEVGVVVAGVVLGVAGAYAGTRVLAASLYGVTARDPTTLAAVALLLGGTALLACWLPARRASRVDPSTALRME